MLSKDSDRLYEMIKVFHDNSACINISSIVLIFILLSTILPVDDKNYLYRNTLCRSRFSLKIRSLTAIDMYAAQNLVNKENLKTLRSWRHWFTRTKLGYTIQNKINMIDICSIPPSG